MTRLKTLLSGLTVLLIRAPGVGADETAASAADAPAKREGFLIGFSLGFGAVYPCDTCADFGGDFHVGAMASRRLAILAELSAVGGEDHNDGLFLATIAAQYWPSERFWVKAGLGIGEPLEKEFDEANDRRWGGIAAAGYEVARMGRFAFDLEVRGGFVRNRRSLALNLGFNWY